MTTTDYAAFARACSSNERGGVHPDIFPQLRALALLGALTDQAALAVAQMNASGMTAELVPAALGQGFTLRRDLARFVVVTLDRDHLACVGVPNVSRIAPPVQVGSPEELRAIADAHLQALVRALFA